MSINQVTISGNLTKDAELRETAGGMSVLKGSVAVNERRKDPRTGEWEDYPNYVDFTIFGKRAEVLAQYLKKGTKVAIQGKLRQDRWESNGEKRSKLEVIADEIEFGKPKQQAQQVEAYYLDADVPF